MKATAIAHSNIALVKYWGKIGWNNNIPAVGSVSLTLDQLSSKTTVEMDGSIENNRLIINGRPAHDEQLRRVSDFMNVIRQMNGIMMRWDIQSSNNFPTAAGLASSASAFASLALAATHAVGLNLSESQLSALARIGSGSAARSIFGGFVEMPPGRSGSDDPAAFQLEDENFWPLRVLVCVTSTAPKPVTSRDAMALTEANSPFYKAWVEVSNEDIDQMRSAIRDRNLEAVGTIAEHSAMKLHALMMSTKPPLVYWNSGTISVINVVHQMRREGLQAYFTIDAGPQVKVICLEKESSIIADRLQALSDVHAVIKAAPGPAAQLVEVWS
jgi:diphosphomevalonate decarboxylase